MVVLAFEIRIYSAGNNNDKLKTLSANEDDSIKEEEFLEAKEDQEERLQLKKDHIEKVQQETKDQALGPEETGSRKGAGISRVQRTKKAFSVDHVLPNSSVLLAAIGEVHNDDNGVRLSSPNRIPHPVEVRSYSIPTMSRPRRGSPFFLVNAVPGGLEKVWSELRKAVDLEERHSGIADSDSDDGNGGGETRMGVGWAM